MSVALLDRKIIFSQKFVLMKKSVDLCGQFVAVGERGAC